MGVLAVGRGLSVGAHAIPGAGVLLEITTLGWGSTSALAILSMRFLIDSRAEMLKGVRELARLDVSVRVFGCDQRHESRCLGQGARGGTCSQVRKASDLRGAVVPMDSSPFRRL